MLNERDKELITKLCIMEVFGKCMTDDDLVFSSQVLKKKLEVFDLGVTFTNNALGVLSIVSRNSPGMIQIIALEVLKKNKGIKVVGCEQVLGAFNDNYPDVMSKEYEEKWIKQKIVGGDLGCDNLVDTKEYWVEQLK